MDFSEKDAARSKWKLTQRHRRGRGRGGPAPRGRQHTSGARDLGSNQDRYEEPEVDEHAGPVRKSLGADLAELLERADAYDAGYYFRSRANLLEEYGLPPGDALAYQGLSFDLKGLAACLSLLPRNELLATDAFDEDGQERVGQAGTGQPLPEQRQPAVTSAAPAAPQTEAVVAKLAMDGHKPYTPPLSVSAVVPSQTASPSGTAMSSVAAGAVPVHSAAAAHQPARPVPAASAPEPPAAGPAQQRLAPMPPQPLSQQQAQQAQAQRPQQPQQAQQAAGQGDDELDFLLGLMDIQGPGASAPALQPPAAQWPPPLAQPQPAVPIRPLPQQQQQQQQQQPAVGALGGASRIAPAPQQQPKEQSLDEWLDSL